MKYISTRGHSDRKQFCEILLEGLAPDAGLYLPESYPQVDQATLRARLVEQAEMVVERSLVDLRNGLIAVDALVQRRVPLMGFAADGAPMVVFPGNRAEAAARARATSWPPATARSRRAGYGGSPTACATTKRRWWCASGSSPCCCAWWVCQP